MGIATLDSLEDTIHARLLSCQENFTIKDNGIECADGPLVLKQITKLVQPETGYSGYSLISELHNLKLADYGYDLTKLHEAMKNLILRIRASKEGRESVNDTMVRYCKIHRSQRIISVLWRFTRFPKCESSVFEDSLDSHKCL